MSVNFSIKNVPDHLADELRAEAARNHRSVQGELMAMLEARFAHHGQRLTAAEALARLRAKGISSPSESAQIIRELRDG